MSHHNKPPFGTNTRPSKIKSVGFFPEGRLPTVDKSSEVAALPVPRLLTDSNSRISQPLDFKKGWVSFPPLPFLLPFWKGGGFMIVEKKPARWGSGRDSD